KDGVDLAASSSSEVIGGREGRVNAGFEASAHIDPDGTVTSAEAKPVVEVDLTQQETEGKKPNKVRQLAGKAASKAINKKIAKTIDKALGSKDEEESEETASEDT